MDLYDVFFCKHRFLYVLLLRFEPSFACKRSLIQISSLSHQAAISAVRLNSLRMATFSFQLALNSRRHSLFLA